MFRWIAITAAIALAAGVAFAQSSPQTQPALPLGSDQTMGHHMTNGGAMGPSMMDPSTMPMMQMMRMMHMMEAGMGPGMMDQGMGGPMSCDAQSGMEGAPGSYLEGRLAFVKAELAIDQTQETNWQAFAEAVRDRAQPMFHGMHGMHNAATDAFPARIDTHIKMLDDRLSGLKAVRAAAVGLYDHLNPAQKQKADTLLPMSLCM
jgi:hypothetical protein